jgi:hypothetical protein
MDTMCPSIAQMYLGLIHPERDIELKFSFYENGHLYRSLPLSPLPAPEHFPKCFAAISESFQLVPTKYKYYRLPMPS